jgi:hypothetical protein
MSRLKLKFSSHPKSECWDYIKNELSPDDVAIRSGKKFWFICADCCHSFYKSPNSVSDGCWCPYCANKKLCPDNNCEICFDKSFASHEKANNWNYESNNGVKPRDVTKSSNKKFWFLCDCNHYIEKNLCSISRGEWCQYCCNPPKWLCPDECSDCYNKSFASHERAKNWDWEKNEGQDPRYVFKNSHSKFWFLCECNHSIQKILNAISCGEWCQYCSGNSLCKDKKCKSCFDRSFASVEKVKYWDYKLNKVNPRFVAKSSHVKFWFECNICLHLFKSSPNQISIIIGVLIVVMCIYAMISNVIHVMIKVLQTVRNQNIGIIPKILRILGMFLEHVIASSGLYAIINITS